MPIFLLTMPSLVLPRLANVDDPAGAPGSRVQEPAAYAKADEPQSRQFQASCYPVHFTALDLPASRLHPSARMDTASLRDTVLVIFSPSAQQM